MALHASIAMEVCYRNTEMTRFRDDFVKASSVQRYEAWYCEMHSAFLDEQLQLANVRFSSAARDLAFGAKEDCGRFIITEAESSERTRLVTQWENFVVDYSADLRRFRATQQQTLLTTAAFHEWRMFAAAERTERNNIRRECDEAERSLFDAHVRLQRATLYEGENAARGCLSAPLRALQAALLLTRVPSMETQQRVGIELAASVCFRQILMDGFERGFGVLLQLEEQGRAALYSLAINGFNGMQIVGATMVEEDHERRRLFVDEASNRAAALKAFRYTRMNLIADEADDRLPTKARVYLEQQESDQRDLYRKWEAREQHGHAPLWSCLSGYLACRAVLETEIAKWRVSTAIVLEECHTRVLLKQSESATRREVIDKVGSSGDVLLTTYVIAHPFVTADMALAWLDVLVG